MAVKTMTSFDVIAFDADDTLWHNERLYLEAKKNLAEILSSYVSFNELDPKLDEIEAKNISLYGYGITSFTLSMIELAIYLSEGHIAGEEVQKIISIGKGMLQAEVVLMDHVEEALSELFRAYTMMIITKGDLLDQEQKLLRSGIDQYFECVEIVSEKKPQTYKNILSKYKLKPERFLMVGNSMKSDIIPALSIGAHAIHIPAEIHWSLDHLPVSQVKEYEYHEIEHMGQLPDMIRKISFHEA
jgi:putative hydrolase of the HAD superfamily